MVLVDAPINSCFDVVIKVFEGYLPSQVTCKIFQIIYSPQNPQMFEYPKGILELTILDFMM